MPQRMMMIWTDFQNAYSYIFIPNKSFKSAVLSGSFSNIFYLFEEMRHECSLMFSLTQNVTKKREI